MTSRVEPRSFLRECTSRSRLNPDRIVGAINNHSTEVDCVFSPPCSSFPASRWKHGTYGTLIGWFVTSVRKSSRPKEGSGREQVCIVHPHLPPPPWQDFRLLIILLISRSFARDKVKNELSRKRRNIGCPRASLGNISLLSQASVRIRDAGKRGLGTPSAALVILNTWYLHGKLYRRLGRRNSLVLFFFLSSSLSTTFLPRDPSDETFAKKKSTFFLSIDKCKIIHFYDKFSYMFH